MAEKLGPMPDPYPPLWAHAWGTDRLSGYPFVEVNLAPSVLTRLRWIPPGDFMMGSPEGEEGRFDDEGPRHHVILTKGFWLADAPCTQAEWAAVMDGNPSRFKGDDRPVEQVSWDDCQEFCRRVRERVPGLEPRLPTEAEWEYTCRAGTETAFNDGSLCTNPGGKDPALDRLGWFDENSGGETHPVRGKANNKWGVFDMHGNVWEWCSDYWSDKYLPDEQTDPTGPAEGRERVLRGGSWVNRARYCRSASRLRWGPSVRNGNLGFRLASGQ